MIPTAAITAWRKTAPWGEDWQVEQDLILSRVLVDMFSRPTAEVLGQPGVMISLLDERCQSLPRSDNGYCVNHFSRLHGAAPRARNWHVPARESRPTLTANPAGVADQAVRISI